MKVTVRVFSLIEQTRTNHLIHKTFLHSSRLIATFWALPFQKLPLQVVPYYHLKTFLLLRIHTPPRRTYFIRLQTCYKIIFLAAHCLLHLRLCRNQFDSSVTLIVLDLKFT